MKTIRTGCTSASKCGRSICKAPSADRGLILAMALFALAVVPVAGQNHSQESLADRTIKISPNSAPAPARQTPAACARVVLSAELDESSPEVRPDLEYWVERQATLESYEAKLQQQIAELQAMADCDPDRALREQLETQHQVLERLRSLRADLKALVRTYLLPLFELAERDVNAAIVARTEQLAAAERKTSLERSEFLRRIDDIRWEIVAIESLKTAVRQRIEELRAERIRSNKSAELSALQEAASAGRLTVPKQPNAKVHDENNDRKVKR